jgi:ribulose-phosphate 3-epimerase
MAQIVPAVLEQSREMLMAAISSVTKIPGVERIHMDFSDGIFVPVKLVDVSEIDPLNPAFKWEAHLMVSKPADFLDYRICGFSTVIIHQEACAGELDMRNRLSEIKAAKLTAGICINPETPVEAVANLDGMCDYFQVMSVIPGKQGQSFMPVALEKIVKLRKMYPHAIIEVDGGVNETNIKSIKEAGADFIVAGSAIVKSENPAAAFERLKSEIGRG